ncbi:MAG: DciA family protein [Actinomycetota bacterium]|nr:DciA family protein [Actinomycetota bacterium]
MSDDDECVTSGLGDAQKETSVTPLSTMIGGKAAPIVDSPGAEVLAIPAETPIDAPVEHDLARAALADARGVARGRLSSVGRRRGRGVATASGTSGAPDTSRRGGFTAPGPDERDPKLVGSVLAGYVADRGWEQPLAAARVFADWSGLVGAEIAAHCNPTALVAGELKVAAESTAWATQLRLMASAVLSRLVAELGPTVVTKVHFTGPTGPSWKHGGYSVRGTRGPRDTYG